MTTFRFNFMSNRPASALRPSPSSFSLPQRTPINRRLIPPTDLYYHPRWAAQREMDAGRPKRTRARVSYVEPTELDDDIAVQDDVAIEEEEEEAAAVPASEDASTESEHHTEDDSDSDSDSGSDQEFTTDKRKLKAQQKKLALRRTQKKVKKTKDVPFPFMELPPEIRVMIYKTCLVESTRDLSFVPKSNGSDFTRGFMEKTERGHGNYTYKVKRANQESGRTVLQPVILRINKAIRDEAIPYLYSQPFHFTSPQAFRLFFGRLTDASRMSLRDITINGWGDSRNPRRKDVQIVFSLLISAINVRSILLNRHVWSTDDGPGSRHWRRTSSFIDDPYRFWLDIEFWAFAMDAAHGKGAAKAALNFSKLCFGSVKEIENEDEEVDKREKNFMKFLHFSEEAKK
ncbi:hypothetical protein E4T49_02983 [Aureobasidium sp. EXF-10728]|nr:hypothetical protein E4T49_02983 [Aureobasidium sp. EXF-10728]